MDQWNARVEDFVAKQGLDVEPVRPVRGPEILGQPAWI